MAQTLTTTTDWLLDRLLSNTMEMDDSVTSMDPTDEIALAVAGDSWDALASLPASPVVPVNMCNSNMNMGLNSFWDDPLSDLIALKSSINGNMNVNMNMSLNLNCNASFVTKAPPNTPRPPMTNINSNVKCVKTEMVVNPNIRMSTSPDIITSQPHTRPPVPNVANGNLGKPSQVRPLQGIATPPPTPTRYHPAAFSNGNGANTKNTHVIPQPNFNTNVAIRKAEPVLLRPKLSSHSTLPVTRRIQPSIAVSRTGAPRPSAVFSTSTTITSTNMLNKKRSATASSDKGNRRPKRYKSAAPSRFCHVCGRKAATTRVALCGRLVDGLCRKVVCERCINKYGWAKDAPVGKSTPDKNWSCPHCRGVCVPKASCSTYERINSKRKLIPRALLTPEQQNQSSQNQLPNINNQTVGLYNKTTNDDNNNSSSESSNSITSSTTAMPSNPTK